jgi:hypothetical protein
VIKTMGRGHRARFDKFSMSGNYVEFNLDPAQPEPVEGRAQHQGHNQ